jgi:hypothetical protein
VPDDEGTSESSIYFYETARCNIPEYLSSLGDLGMDGKIMQFRETGCEA